MTEFENAMKKVADMVHAAARKSGEILENTKISYNISSERDKIAKIERKIGSQFYKIFKDGGEVPEFIKGDLEAINAIEEKIRQLEKTISDSKPYKFCTDCGSKLELSDIYCAKCGAKQHDNAEPQEDDKCDEAESCCDDCCDDENKDDKCD